MTQQKMTHTVVGLFDDKTQAQTAMQDLVKNGFVKESIDLSNKKAATAPTSATTPPPDESVGDSISNFFSSLFGADSPEARNYSDVAADTEGILTVQTDSKEKASQAAEILDRNGAVDVNERANQYQAQSGATAKNKTVDKGAMKIPVIEEELQIGKRTVEQGGARVRSRIIEKPVEETVRLRKEHVVVNRRPVDRAATASDFSNFKEGEMEITERAEQPVVSKQARVTEEVAIGKNVEEREKTVSDTVRRTEVDVEEINQDVNARKANNR